MKNTQKKIILIYIFTGFIASFGLGLVVNIQISKLKQNLIQLDDFCKNINFAIFSLLVIYLFSFFILLMVLSKIVIVPMNRLIKSAEKISKTDNKKLSRLKDLKKKSNLQETKISDIFNIITDELNNKLALVQTQKNQIEAILLHMTDGLIAFDKDGQIILINPEAKKLLDISPEDGNFNSIFLKFNNDMNFEKVMYLDNITATNEYININNKYLNVYFAPFKDEENRQAGIISVIQNISEHVKLDEMRKEFIADVSHELKTPLTTIMGYSETLLSDDYDKEIQNRFLNMILSEAQRMARLVADLLTLSKYEQKNLETTKSEFDLVQLIKTTTEKIQIEAEKKKQKIECQVTSDMPLAYGNKDDIERVFINILTNAIKYTNEKGRIKIYLGCAYNNAYIKVIDNGIGIPKDSLEKIFERFYRVDKSRTRQMGGTGLGLAIAKEILDKNGGEISIQSEVGKGTTVTIKIPTINKDEI